LCGPAEDEAERFALAPAAVEAGDELGEVAREVLSAHAMECALQPGLEVAEDPMHPRKDLGRAGGIQSLDPPFVLDADLGEAAVALKAS